MPCVQVEANQLWKPGQGLGPGDREPGSKLFRLRVTGIQPVVKHLKAWGVGPRKGSTLRLTAYRCGLGLKSQDDTEVNTVSPRSTGTSHRPRPGLSKGSSHPQTQESLV
jgi:hypothetical protein